MLLTQLEYFVALAREQHFGRAAAVSFVSTSALSESIRKLEAELGVPLVRRGRAFEGLTPEGEAVLVWARRMISDHRSLKDEVRSSLARLDREVRIGVIPSGIALAARVVAELCAEHPGVRVELVTGQTSEEVSKGLRGFDFDAGILHPAPEPSDDIRHVLVETDRFVLVGSAHREDLGHPVAAASLRDLDICVLRRGMRARDLLDDALATQGVRVRPRVEADSVEALLALARSGPWVSVVPASAVPRAAESVGVTMVEFADQIGMPVALATLSDEPRTPLALAVDAAARRLASARVPRGARA
jgi:DNA-binding transcriptional LysR family regulator